MDFGIVVKRRRMVRSFLDKPVAEDAIGRVVAAALAAPSAGHSQGVRLVVVTAAQRRRQIALAAGEPEWVAKGYRPWLSVAPVHLVLGVRPDDYRDRYDATDKAGSRQASEWEVPYWWFDAGAAFEAVLLAAVNEDLAAGFQGAHNVPGLAAIVGWSDVDAAGVITLGHELAGPSVGSGVARERRSDRIQWIRQ